MLKMKSVVKSIIVTVFLVSFGSYSFSQGSEEFSVSIKAIV